MNIHLIKLIQAVGTVSLLCASVGAGAQPSLGALPPPKPQAAQAARPSAVPAPTAPRAGASVPGSGRSAMPKAYRHNNPDPFAPKQAVGPALPSSVPGLPPIGDMQHFGRPGGMPGMPGMPGSPIVSGDLDAEALGAAKATGEYLGVADGDRVWRLDGILYFEKTEKKIKAD